MLQDYTGAQWNAQAKVDYDWGRELTAQETQDLGNKRVELLSNGAICKNSTDESGNRTIFWSTVTTATEWLNYINTFSPPPVSATLTQI